jgi:membrane dipeptidase
MKIIDAHCDVLYKMFLNRELDFFAGDPRLDVTYPGLKKAGVALQFFAIYLPDSLASPTFDHILEYIDLFHRNILTRDDVIFVKNAQDLQNALGQNKPGALLSLEGVDGLEGNLAHLRILYYLGVRAVGITWNYANWAADGVMEPRKGGFTSKGRQLIQECHRLGMIVDVSHLSVKGFWELAEMSDEPFIASHSNAYAVCPHPRNLSDEQIREIIRRGGVIGVTFVPKFVYAASPPSLHHILLHIDHICGLGGGRNIGFGSDFDGIDTYIPGLEKVEAYERLVNELVKHYPADLVERLLYKNWQHFLEKQLASQTSGESPE